MYKIDAALVKEYDQGPVPQSDFNTLTIVNHC